MVNEVGIDVNLFLALNGNLGSLMDNIMWIASSKLTTAPLVVTALYIIYRRFGLKQLLLTILTIAIVILIADQTCQYFKSNLPRLRPTHQPLLEGLIHTVNGYKGGNYGTVSAHAANTFGILVLCSLIIKRWWYTSISILLALTVCFSRIYLGVHFPLDIMYGTILGVSTAFISYKVCKLCGMYRKKRKYNPLTL